MRETRVNSRRKDLYCPEPLTSFVTENGSGPSQELSYSYVNENRGQVILSRILLPGWENPRGVVCGYNVIT